jgi:hypothetical protein
MCIDQTGRALLIVLAHLAGLGLFANGPRGGLYVLEFLMRVAVWLYN